MEGTYVVDFQPLNPTDEQEANKAANEMEFKSRKDDIDSAIRRTLFVSLILATYLGTQVTYTYSYSDEFFNSFQTSQDLSSFGFFMMQSAFSVGQSLGAPFYGFVGIHYNGRKSIKNSTMVTAIASIIGGFPTLVPKNYRQFTSIMVRMLAGFSCGAIVQLRVFIPRVIDDLEFRAQAEGYISTAYCLGLCAAFLLVSIFDYFDNSKNFNQPDSLRYTLPCFLMGAFGIGIYFLLDHFYVNYKDIRSEKKSLARDILAHNNPKSVGNIQDEHCDEDAMPEKPELRKRQSKGAIYNKYSNYLLGGIFKTKTKQVAFILISLMLNISWAIFFITFPAISVTTTVRKEYGWDSNFAGIHVAYFVVTYMVFYIIGAFVCTRLYTRFSNSWLLFISLVFYVILSILTLPIFSSTYPVMPSNHTMTTTAASDACTYSWCKKQHIVTYLQIILTAVGKGFNGSFIVTLITTLTSIINSIYSPSSSQVFQQTLFSFSGCIGNMFLPLFLSHCFAAGGPMLQYELNAILVGISALLTLFQIILMKKLEPENKK